MNYKQILITTLCITNSTFAADSKPNIIIIMSDDQGYADLGCYGATTFATPNIDRMAQEGIRLSSYYSAPSCSPARASLLTGCIPHRLGIRSPLNGPATGLHTDEITLAEHLKAQGYATALIGKWHLGLPDSMSPTAQGFDYFSGLPLSQIRYGETPHTDGKKAYYRRQWRRNGVDIKEEIEFEPDEAMFTQRCTEEALTYISKNKNNPFFLFLAHPQVHKEVLASPAFSGRTEHGIYGDAVEELDWSVGEVLKKLKEEELDKKTLVLYTSDNGPWLKQGKQSGSAKPLRAGKFTTWEGGVRVPCIMRWPGKIPAGIESDEIVSVMDIFPTIAKYLNTQMPQDRIIDGKDIWPILSGQQDSKSPHQLYLYCNKGHLMGIRMGDWKYHIDGNEKQLYNLSSDIGETNNVSDRYPEIMAQLEKQLNKKRVELGDRNTEGSHSRPLGQVSAQEAQSVIKKYRGL